MRRHHQALDGLRALAVGIVVYGHTEGPLIRPFLGVDVFFTLSGFLITSLLLAEHTEHGSISLKNFYARRVLRLTPALWAMLVYVALLALLLPADRSPLLSHVGFAATYTTNWARILGAPFLLHRGSAVVDSPLSHTWSLAIEEQYYALWPLIVLACCRWIPPRARGLALGFAGVVLAGYRALMIGTFTNLRLNQGLDTHADGLLIGASLAALLASCPDAWARLPAPTRTALKVLSILTVAALLPFQGEVLLRFGFLATALSTAVLIADGVSSPASAVKTLLCSPPLQRIGRLSYGIYLWHVPIFFSLRYWGPMWHWARLLVVGSALTVGVAHLSYEFLEARFLRMKNRFERKHSAPAVSAQN